MKEFDAIVTAGGRGTRIKELQTEKPLILVRNVPMIDRVLQALRSTRGIGEVYVSVSERTPLTEEYLTRKKVAVLRTEGAGYCQDLAASMSVPRADHVVVCPADIPLLTPTAIQAVLDAYQHAGKESMSVCVPSEVLESLGLTSTFTMEVEGRPVVPCGVNVMNRKAMLSGRYLDETFYLTDSMDFAVNVNTISDLRRAEMLLDLRSSRPSESSLLQSR